MTSIQTIRVVPTGRNGNAMRCEALCPSCHQWFFVEYGPSQAEKRGTATCMHCDLMLGLRGLDWRAAPVFGWF